MQDSKELVDWVAESGKNLIAIYVTHAHGDHFFGLKLLLDRFPNIRDFNQVAASTSTAMDLYEKMLALHPNRVNPGSLWATAKALRGNAHASGAQK